MGCKNSAERIKSPWIFHERSILVRKHVDAECPKQISMFNWQQEHFGQRHQNFITVTYFAPILYSIAPATQLVAQLADFKIPFMSIQWMWKLCHWFLEGLFCDMEVHTSQSIFNRAWAVLPSFTTHWTRFCWCQCVWCPLSPVQDAEASFTNVQE